MADLTKKPEKKEKPKKPKKKVGKIDQSQLIFFGLLVLGIIIFAVIIITKPTSKIYRTQYGDSIVASIEVFSNNKIDIAIDINDTRIIQSGTFKQIDDITYEIQLEDDTENQTVTMIIQDDTLTLKYSDGLEVVLKEYTK